MRQAVIEAMGADITIDIMTTSKVIIMVHHLPPTEIHVPTKV
jgi:hypothetical protein